MVRLLQQENPDPHVSPNHEGIVPLQNDAVAPAEEPAPGTPMDEEAPEAEYTFTPEALGEYASYPQPASFTDLLLFGLK